MRPDADPFPIVAARSWAAGAVHAMSVADAYWLQDDPRCDEAVDEALAGLDQARARLIAIRDRRRPRRPLAAAAVLVAGLAALWLAAPDAAWAGQAAAELEPFRWNGLSLFAVVAGACALLFIPVRRRK